MPTNSWHLVSKTCGKCCDNVAMGDQIEALPTLTERQQRGMDRLRAMAEKGGEFPSSFLAASAYPPASEAKADEGRHDATREIDKASSREDLEERCAWNREKRLEAQNDAVALRAELEKVKAELVQFRKDSGAYETKLCARLESLKAVAGEMARALYVALEPGETDTDGGGSRAQDAYASWLEKEGGG